MSRFAAFARLLRRLWPLLRQLLLLTSLSLPPALAFAIRKIIGARRRAMPELSFSDFWRDASLGRLQEARGSDEHANVRMHELLRPSACRNFVEYFVAPGRREVAPPS
ncbi:unnamed protein product [Ectocarpus sp. 4 AP-2014]